MITFSTVRNYSKTRRKLAKGIGSLPGVPRELAEGVGGLLGVCQKLTEGIRSLLGVRWEIAEGVPELVMMALGVYRKKTKRFAGRSSGVAKKFIGTLAHHRRLRVAGAFLPREETERLPTQGKRSRR
ncbi:hypothetical protein GW17_00037419 [Ensete ventricosum]|nr:hypothetical protein GW17_00037419 [Ensete ventricosum]